MFNTLNQLRWWLRRLVAHGAPHGLDAAVPRIARPGARDVAITEDELHLVFDIAQPWLRLAVLLLHDCGLRSGTMLRTSWEHIQGDCLIQRTKRQAVTRVPLSGRLRALLAVLPRGTAPLVELARGKPVSKSVWWKEWHVLLASASIRPNLKPHDCRRSMARKVYELTGDLRVAQQLLGHTRLMSTLNYLETGGGQDKLLAAVTEVTNEN